MNEDISYVLEDIIYFKLGDKLMISRYLWKFNTSIIKKPIIYNLKDWPAFKSRIIFKENSIHIKKLFVNKFLILKGSYPTCIYINNLFRYFRGLL